MHPYEPRPDPLTMPVGALANHHDPVQTGSSIRVAAQAMAEAGLHAIMVASGARLIGVLEEKSLLEAMARGIGPNDPVDSVMDTEPLTIQPHYLGAEALRILNQSGRHAIAVVDVMGNAVGIITPARLFHPPSTSYPPQIVGGLATPFGVYLTNGNVGGGAKGFALVAAGMALFAAFLVAAHIVMFADYLLPLDGSIPLVKYALEGAPLLLFLVILRLSPISGTHGAEHMVVHAIERGEDLEPDVVRRMPRVHPRCGTNLAVGAMIFTAIITPEWAEMGLRVIVAMLATLFLWKPLGSIVQYVFTTKEPNAKQLESGIRAGKELLAASARAPRRHASILQRFASSGILHVIGGAMIAEAATLGLVTILQVPDAWRVL